MSESVILVLPLPPPCLSPNRPPGSIGGRMRKARIAKRYRDLACQRVEDLGIESGPWSRATVSVTFFHKTKRRRDDVNHLAMLKPAYDGMVDAGLLEDDDSEHLTTLGATFEIDVRHPRVEVLVMRAE